MAMKKDMTGEATACMYFREPVKIDINYNAVLLSIFL